MLEPSMAINEETINGSPQGGTAEKMCESFCLGHLTCPGRIAVYYTLLTSGLQQFDSALGYTNKIVV